MKTVFFSAAALAAVFGATAAQADVTEYNAEPDDTWFFGDGNDYVPGNTKVLTTGAGNQLYLRWHEPYVGEAPVSVGSLYSFPLGMPEGTGKLSFDWGIDAGDFTNVTALLTLTNLGTGVSISDNPLIHDLAGKDDDNELANGSVQNSYQVNWINDIAGYSGFFDPNVDSSYRVQLDVFGLAGGDKSIYADAQLGAGAPAVPEPATWAMMILGMGLIGGLMRRKAKVAVSYS